MNKFLIVSSIIALPLTACNSSTEETSNNQTLQTTTHTIGNSTAQYTSKSCVAEDQDEPLTEDGDIFVSIDSLYFETLTDAIYNHPDESFSLTMAHGQAVLPTISLIFIPLMSVFCSHDLFALNQCTYVMNDDENDTTVSGSMSGNTLSFTVENYDKKLDEQSTIDIVFEDTYYRKGSMITREASGNVVTVNWNRDIYGTEYFSSSDQLGNQLQYKENSDCSGTMSSESYDEDLDLINRTMSASWSTAGQPDFQYTSCFYNSEAEGLECSSGGL